VLSESTTPAAPTPAPLPTALFLCLGFARGVSDKALTKYWIITTDELESGESLVGFVDNTRAWSVDARWARKHSMASIGAVYELEYDRAERIVRVGAYAKMIGRWPVEADVVRWSALSKADQSAWAAEDAAKKESRVDTLRKNLEPIRRAYREANSPQRAQLLALFVEMITRQNPL
jgi:hypothetical protein